MPRRVGDDGASAVEFALLVTLFLLIVFGLISAGFAFSHQIAIRQAARESSRFGSTLPIPPDTNLTVDDWLTDVYDAAVAAGGDSLNATTPVPGQFVCVAYVAGTATGGSQPTISHSVPSADGPPSTSPCWDDSSSGLAPDSRVQVLIRRDTDWNTLFASGTITLTSRSITPYERTVP
jgi:Flp pilus assembly protein TadG